MCTSVIEARALRKTGDLVEMSRSHIRSVHNVDPRSVAVHFSPAVRNAFANLEAAVHFSEHVDGDIRSILHDWASDKPRSVHDVLSALPVIAEETFRHIRATGDQRAEEAWREICNQMPEKGFILSKSRSGDSRSPPL